MWKNCAVIYLPAMKTTEVIYGIFLLFGTMHWVSGELRILGGTDAIIEDHPWDISIRYKTNHFCGGAIISPDFVLTASHCFYTKRNFPFLEYCDVVAGVTDLNYTDSGQKSTIFDVYFHYLFDQKTFDYDIAIIKLNTPLNYNSRVKKIRLPESGEEFAVGSPMTISGWGIIDAETKDTKSVLQVATIYAPDRAYCDKVLSPHNNFTERMFCAGVPSGEQDTCQGDSGGPVEANGTLYGIVSWGAGCGNAGLPGAYTLVSYFRSWILTATGV